MVILFLTLMPEYFEFTKFIVLLVACLIDSDVLVFLELENF